MKERRRRFAPLLPALLLLTLWRGLLVPVHTAEHGIEHALRACAGEAHERHVHAAESPAPLCHLCHQAAQSWDAIGSVSAPLPCAQLGAPSAAPGAAPLSYATFSRPSRGPPQA